MGTSGHLFWNASHDKDMKGPEYNRKWFPQDSGSPGAGAGVYTVLAQHACCPDLEPSIA